MQETENFVFTCMIQRARLSVQDIRRVRGNDYRGQYSIGRYSVAVSHAEERQRRRSEVNMTHLVVSTLEDVAGEEARNTRNVSQVQVTNL